MAAGFLGHGAIRSVGSYRLGRKQGKPWNRIARYKLTSKLNNHLPSLGQYKHLQYTPVRYFPQVPKTGVTESGAALVFHSQVQEQREKGFSKELQKQGIVFQVSCLARLPDLWSWTLLSGFTGPDVWFERRLCAGTMGLHTGDLCVFKVWWFSPSDSAQREYINKIIHRKGLCFSLTYLIIVP